MQHARFDQFSTALPTIAGITAKAPVDDLHHVKLFDLDLVDATVAHTIEHMLAPGRRRVHFVNAHCANIAAKDAAYRKALRTSDMLLPDGIGVELAGRMIGKSFTANLNGTDLTPQLIQKAAERGLSVYLFGGKPGTAEKASNTLCRQAPGLRIAGCRDGFDGARDNAAAIEEINNSGADILLVAMGVPLQDTWLADNYDALAPRLVLGVGALFDFLAGNVSRAPGPVRAAKMEWVWRLAMEPRRMARRYLLGNAIFMAAAARHAVAQGALFQSGKRAVDLTVAGGALLVLGPLLLLAALAIRLDSRGPVFFRQNRVGLNGDEFSILKFRSMHVDAEARRAELAAVSERDGVCMKSRNDPRITRVGHILRRFSVDELPQILNVLRGDMSIVGPRPSLPNEVAAFPEHAHARTNVRPGITGLWQVSGRADIGFDKMVDLDLAYARSSSILLDLYMILLTFRAVVTARGAY